MEKWTKRGEITGTYLLIKTYTYVHTRRTCNDARARAAWCCDV